jgi:glycosyltransferase involved in cell wall biosynthesis
LPDPLSQPLVDIVLPTYGAVPYLAEALDSAFAQTYSNWRLTLVDNSPETGGARGVLEPYQDDPRVRYLATGGLSQADNWTAGFRSGDAPYIAMLHDDDLWDPPFIARRVTEMEAHPACAMVFSAYRQIDERGRVIGLHAPRARQGVLEPAEFVPREFVRNAIPVTTVLYRRTAFESAGGSFDGASGYIDYHLWIRLAARHPVLSLHLQDCSLRSHGGSVTSAFQNSQRNGEVWLRFVDHAEAAIDEVDPALVPARLRHRRRAAALVSVAADEAMTGHPDEVRRLLRAALRLHPPAVLDPRIAVLAALLTTGPRAAGFVAAARKFKTRWHIPTSRQDLKRRVDDLQLTARARARG